VADVVEGEEHAAKVAATDVPVDSETNGAEFGLGIL
jgi:hypothetical protein